MVLAKLREANKREEGIALFIAVAFVFVVTVLLLTATTLLFSDFDATAEQSAATQGRATSENLLGEILGLAAVADIEDLADNNFSIPTYISSNLEWVFQWTPDGGNGGIEDGNPDAPSEQGTFYKFDASSSSGYSQCWEDSNSDNKEDDLEFEPCFYAHLFEHNPRFFTVELTVRSGCLNGPATCSYFRYRQNFQKRSFLDFVEHTQSERLAPDLYPFNTGKYSKDWAREDVSGSPDDGRCRGSRGGTMPWSVNPPYTDSVPCKDSAYFSKKGGAEVQDTVNGPVHTNDDFIFICARGDGPNYNHVTFHGRVEARNRFHRARPDTCAPEGVGNQGSDVHANVTINDFTVKVSSQLRDICQLRESVSLPP